MHQYSIASRYKTRELTYLYYFRYNYIISTVVMRREGGGPGSSLPFPKCETTIILLIELKIQFDLRDAVIAWRPVPLPRI